jgi:hypothetical protein
LLSALSNLREFVFGREPDNTVSGVSYRRNDGLISGREDGTWVAFKSVTNAIAANGSKTITAPTLGEVPNFRYLAVYVQNVGTGDVFLGTSLASGIKFPAGMTTPVELQIAPGDALTFFAGATAVTDLRLAGAYQ